MTVPVVTVRNPFHPQASREVSTAPAGAMLAEIAPPQGNRPYLVLNNGAAVLRRQWGAVSVRPGDVVVVCYLPQDGGGGSDPMRLVLTLAVLIVAPQLGAMAAEWAFMETAASIAMSAAIGAGVTAVAGFAGMALVNAIVPPPRPPSSMQMAQLAAPSPTYSLQAQGNMARLGSAIPVQYGRLQAYPDFAAQPYAEYAGNEQYLYHLLCLGWGEHEIEAVRIEDTSVDNFAEIDYEVIPPGGTVTMFPANVATSGEVSGQELVGMRAATYAQSGTTITVTLADHNIATGRTVYLDFTSGTAADGAFTVATVPDTGSFTVTDTVSRTTSGSVNVQVYLGPFTASGAGTAANHLGIDLVCPRGLYQVDTGTGNLLAMSAQVVIETRRIDDSGAPIEAWTTLGSEAISDKTTTPQRLSFRYGVSSGRHEVRARRTDSKQTGTSYGHELIWAGLRAYMPDTIDYGNVTLIALRMRASNNLSLQASRKINVVCTRKLPVWDGSSWSAPQPTSSIAWALADACRNTDYGAGKADGDYDLAWLLSMAAYWQARGDEFNGRFDNHLGWWEALGRIAQAGRTRPYRQGGIVRFHRDQPSLTTVALYSMRNIAAGSFGVEYVMPSDATADAVDVGYFDAGRWTPRRVTAALPDSAAARPAKIELFGVTSREQAYREGLYHAASNRYRRRIIRFTTELEGFIPSFGDLIAVQHDMVAWGQYAEAVGWDAAAKTLTLSEPVTWTEGANHYIGARTATGGMVGPYPVTAGADQHTVVLTYDPMITWETAGTTRERTHVVFGPGEAWRQPARVIAVRPRGLYQLELEAVNEDPSVHTADQGVTAPAIVTSQLPTVYTAPQIAGLTLRSSTSDTGKALLTWTPAPGAERYQIEMAAGTDPYATGVSWTRVGETSANNYAVTAIYGAQTLIRVRGVGMAAGPWVILFFGEAADYMWTSDTALMWAADSGTLMWRY